MIDISKRHKVKINNKISAFMIDMTLLLINYDALSSKYIQLLSNKHYL